MGTWGTYPKDSDSCLDWNRKTDDAINQQLAAFSKNSKINPWDYSGLVMIQLQRGVFVSKNLVKKALSDLKELAINKEWIAKWDNEEKIKSDIQLLIDGFETLISENKKSQFVLAERNWMARDFELKRGASWSGLIELNEEK